MPDNFIKPKRDLLRQRQAEQEGRKPAITTHSVTNYPGKSNFFPPPAPIPALPPPPPKPPTPLVAARPLPAPPTPETQVIASRKLPSPEDRKLRAKLGGKARQASMSPEERRKLGRKAARTRLARQSLRNFDIQKLNRQAKAELKKLAELAQEEGIPPEVIEEELAEEEA